MSDTQSASTAASVANPSSSSSSSTAAATATAACQILSKQPLDDADAKWVKLRAIQWKDPTGRERRWECAERITRKGDVDAVAICTLVRRASSPSPTDGFGEPHILLVSQFRPPIGKSCVEMPAGLVDAGESGEAGVRRAALRELREETGYGSEAQLASGRVGVAHVSRTMYSDPGMTSANMQLAVVRVDVGHDEADPVAEPDDGEFIEKYLVPLRQLYARLQAFQDQGFHVDARLYHFAAGVELMRAAKDGGGFGLEL